MIRLKNDLQRELNLPGASAGSQNLTEASHGPAARKSSPRPSGCKKVGPVQNIEEFGTELEVGRLAQGKPLVDGEIKGGQSGTFRGVASQVAKITWLLLLEVVGDRSKPGVGIPDIGAVITAWNQVGPAAAEVVAGPVSIPANINRLTAGHLNDAIDLPSFHHPGRQPTQPCAKATAGSKGQIQPPV